MTAARRTLPSKQAEQSPAVKSLRKEQSARRDKGLSAEDELRQGLKDSFPASDPVSVTNTVTAGDASKRRKD